MGIYLPKPKVNKIKKSGHGKNFKYATASMQGYFIYFY